MDRISPRHRSWNMSRIRATGTSPEKTVRSALFKGGLRFRINVRDLPGKPDIVLKRYRVVVFVHGCFWHRHLGCKFAYTPKSHSEFWETKFRRNVERDREVEAQLRQAGWRYLVIWECEVSDDSRLQALITEIRSNEGINGGKSSEPC